MKQLASLTLQITDREYQQIQGLIFEWAGISLGPNKRPLVVGRLSKRLRHYGLTSFTDYLTGPLKQQPEEQQIMTDLLTTNETYFFREPAHFDFLKQQALPKLANQGKVRVWSAACSSGEEPYTLAMVLDEALPGVNWSILATDISMTVLEVAKAGLYGLNASHKIPQHYLQRYCLKGVRSQAGVLRIDPALQRRIDFQQLNLQADFEQVGSFDIIFLRNVMIYFDTPTKQRLISRMERRLNPGGYLIVGHSETLNGLGQSLTMCRPSIYQKTV